MSKNNNLTNRTSCNTVKTSMQDPGSTYVLVLTEKRFKKLRLHCMVLFLELHEATQGNTSLPFHMLHRKPEEGGTQQLWSYYRTDQASVPTEMTFFRSIQEELQCWCVQSGFNSAPCVRFGKWLLRRESAEPSTDVICGAQTDIGLPHCLVQLFSDEHSASLTCCNVYDELCVNGKIDINLNK